MKYYAGSDGGSASTAAVKSSSQEPSTSSSPKQETTKPETQKPTKPDTKDHVIQIEPEAGSPSKSLYITKEEDSNLQKPIKPTTSTDGKSEQILSAATLAAQHTETKPPDDKPQTASPPPPKEESKPAVKVSTADEGPSASAPKPSTSAPKPSTSAPKPPASKPPPVGDKGRSKVTGKIVSGWL